MHSHLTRLRNLAEAIRANQRYPSHRTRLRYRLEDAEAIEWALAKLEPCDGHTLHLADCPAAVLGGEGGLA